MEDSNLIALRDIATNLKRIGDLLEEANEFNREIMQNH